jgi:hypothetical protein
MKVKKILSLTIIIFLLLFWIIQSINPYRDFMTKGYILSKVDKKYTLSLKIIRSLNDIDKIEKYPVIFKPDVCNGNSTGVVLINSKKEAIKLMKKTILINRKITYLVQDFYQSKYEGTILYERYPICKKGKIVSIILKEIPTGKWKPLRCYQPLGKDENYTICYERSDLITHKLTTIIDNISQKLPKLYAGRIDIRFSNIEDLKEGKNFKILEINGTMGYDGRVLVNYCNKRKKYYYMIRWLMVRLIIGIQNILLFNSQNIIWLPEILFNNIKRTIECDDTEHLFQPSSF